MGDLLRFSVHDKLTSICEGCIDDLDIDALLGSITNDVTPEDAASIPKPDELRIYSHGYTVRVVLKTSNPEDNLAKIGWSESSSEWRSCDVAGGRRWTMRGSSFLTLRAPQLRKGGSSPMALLNKRLKTRLYSIEFDQAAETFLIIRGVRHHDLERLLEDHLGLKPDEYDATEYHCMERFFVLPPHEAIRLAQGLKPESLPTPGRGRTSRKRWLLKDHEVPVVVRTRAKRLARINIYRINGGATAPFKVEICLKGRRQNKGHFSKDDISKLDAVLMELIKVHELHPSSKPERWEPRRPPQWRRDGRLAKLGTRAYRGRKVSPERIRACQEGNTPKLRFWANSSASTTTSLCPPLIRKVDTATSLPHPVFTPWKRIAEDLKQYEGYLSEVVLNCNQDPADVVRAIVGTEPAGSVSVGVLTTDDGEGYGSWNSLKKLIEKNPSSEDTNTLVVVVDSSVHLAIDHLVAQSIEESLTSFSPGPFFKPYWHDTWCSMPLYIEATAAFLSPMLEELRSICETTGQRVVLITVDARPEHGMGRLLKTHFFRDGRVRSHIGDAGRYFAHLRYLVESDDNGIPVWVGMTKDEGQGLPGRMLWGMPASA